MSGDLGRWAQQVAGALNVMPKLSYTSYATPEGLVDGGTGDVLINLVTDATVPRVWVKQSDAVVNAGWSALAGSGGGMTAVNSVVGTTDRITVTPTTGNVVVNISSTYDALWGAKYGVNDSPTFGTVTASHVSSSGLSASNLTGGTIVALAGFGVGSAPGPTQVGRYSIAHTAVTGFSYGLVFVGASTASANGDSLYGWRLACAGVPNGKSNVTWTQLSTQASSQALGAAVGIEVGPIYGATVNLALSTSSGLVVLGDTTDASTSTSGAVTIAGGLGVAKAIYSGTTVTALQGDIGFPYGTFYSTVSQSITTTVAAQVLTFNAQGPFSRISHSTSGNPSRIGILDAGAYLITFSGIGKETTADKTHLDVWLRKDGSDVTASNTRVELPTKETEAVTAVSFIETFTANQYFEFATHGDSTGLAWLATPSGTTPTRPLCPSLIVTVNKVSK
jgi:hypothetical protein